jgi:hypothetical protein
VPFHNYVREICRFTEPLVSEGQNMRYELLSPEVSLVSGLMHLNYIAFD